MGVAIKISIILLSGAIVRPNIELNAHSSKSSTFPHTPLDSSSESSRWCCYSAAEEGREASRDGGEGGDDGQESGGGHLVGVEVARGVVAGHGAVVGGRLVAAAPGGQHHCARPHQQTRLHGPPRSLLRKERERG